MKTYQGWSSAPANEIGKSSSALTILHETQSAFSLSFADQSKQNRSTDSTSIPGSNTDEVIKQPSRLGNQIRITSLKI